MNPLIHFMFVPINSLAMGERSTSVGVEAHAPGDGSFNLATVLWENEKDKAVLPVPFGCAIEHARDEAAAVAPNATPPCLHVRPNLLHLER